MIYCIVAIDEKNGMANDHGIPWGHKLTRDVKRFREKTTHTNVLMGYATYKEFDKPLSDRKNYVASTKQETLREGFELVSDAIKFLQDAKKANQDVWVIGGPGLIAATFDLIDTMEITQLEGTYDCTKFLPEFTQDFELKEEAEPITESGITYRFQTWVRK